MSERRYVIIGPGLAPDHPLQIVGTGWRIFQEPRMYVK